MDDIALSLHEAAEPRQLQEQVQQPAAVVDVRSLTIYPEPIFTNEQIKQGGFLLYLFGTLLISF